jgi:rare lipoprotein A
MALAITPSDHGAGATPSAFGSLFQITIAVLLSIGLLGGLLHGRDQDNYVVSLRDANVSIVLSLAEVGLRPGVQSSADIANAPDTKDVAAQPTASETVVAKTVVAKTVVAEAVPLRGAVAPDESWPAKLGNAIARKARASRVAHALASIVGVASTYNPFRDDAVTTVALTASGEPYDPAAWTAAIQIDLRQQFGGVRYGRNYRPTFALLECGDKRAIVKINDVGPLRPGRVIDLNEKAMHYFDPTMRQGLVHDMKVTLLAGNHWTPGPVDGEFTVNVASAD